MALGSKILLVAGLLTLVACPAEAQTAAPSGAMLGAACVLCHGPDSAGAGAVPGLKGHNKDYLVVMMKAFRSGERPATVMGRVAKGFSDAEIDAVSAYYAGLK
ncbi:MAG: cytochrome C [Alphaproteobacteria bacterium]|nr:cytochrome C [Alphaproteobacteria bacterium]